MFIIIKYSMAKQINTLVGGPPRFLTTQFEIDVRDATEKAIAHYIKEKNLTPKQFAKSEFRIGWLHHYLCKYDRRWTEIPPHEMKTTPPSLRQHRHMPHSIRQRHTTLHILEGWATATSIEPSSTAFRQWPH